MVLGFGGGIRGDMGDNEVEEGEKFSCHEGNADAAVDPDVSFSDIDKKLQKVLGHFQKDFEGGVSVDNLGSKFGGYGSFLSAQTRSPQKPNNYQASRSPRIPYLKSTYQNIGKKNPTNAPVSIINNTSFSTAPPSDDICTSVPSASGYIPQSGSINKPADVIHQKSLKVRIRLCPENILARNNATLYSDLGLDDSQSSSPEDSSNTSGGSTPDFQDDPGESPMDIYQFYTCFGESAFGPPLLSPLPEDILHIKESPCLKDHKIGEDCDGSLGSLIVSRGEVPCARTEKNIKSIKKKSKPSEVKVSNSEAGVIEKNSTLKKEIDIKALADRELIAIASNIPLLSSSKCPDNTAELHPVDKAVDAGASQVLKEVLVKDKVLSPDFSNKKPSESTTCPEENIVCCVKGKLSLKPRPAGKTWEKRKIDASKDDESIEQWKDGKGNAENSSELIRADLIESKCSKESLESECPAESVKLETHQKPIVYEQDQEELLKGKERSSGSLRKLKGIQASDKPFPDFKKASKEKKKSLHSKGKLPDIKSKVFLSSQKEPSRIPNTECPRNNTSSSDRTNILGNLSKRKTDFRIEYEMDNDAFAQKFKEMSGSTKNVNSMAAEALDKCSEAAPLLGSDSTSVLVQAPSVPDVIEENWVCCDRCEKWRLLPYGTNTDHLPKKWHCTMLHWLPGMNKCSISEDETTKALHALYYLPVPEVQVVPNHDIATSGVTFSGTTHSEQSHDSELNTVPGAAKKMSSMKEASISCYQLAMDHLSETVKKNKQTSIRFRNKDGNPHLLDLNLVNKSASQTNNSKKQRHKQKEKHQLLVRCTDTGNSNEHSGKDTKSKNKRKFDQGSFRSSKKVKSEDLHYAGEGSYSTHDSAGKTALNVINDMPIKLTVKNPLKFKDHSHSRDLKYKNKGYLTLSGKLEAPVQAESSDKAKEVVSTLNVESPALPDLSGKKRKTEWLEKIDPYTTVEVDVEVGSRETELIKEKKASVFKSTGKEFRSSKNGGVSKISLPFSRNQKVLEDANRCSSDNDYQVSCRNMNGLDSLKMDLGYFDPCTAAASSSSKVFGSHKSENFQEPNGSPVESVSSSPLRIPSIDELNTTRSLKTKAGMISVDACFTESSIRCPGGEVNVEHNQVGSEKKVYASSTVQSNRVRKSLVLDPMIQSRDFQDREPDHRPDIKAGDRLFPKIVGVKDDETSPSGYEETNIGAGTGITFEQHNELKVKDHDLGPEQLNDHFHSDIFSTKRMPGKNSSSRHRERQGISKTNAYNHITKASGLSSNQEDPSHAKKGNCFRYKADTLSHTHSTFHGDLRDGKGKILETDPKSCLVKKDVGGKFLVEGKGGNPRNSGMQVDMEIHGPLSLAKQHNDPTSTNEETATVFENIHERIPLETSRNDEKSSNHLVLDRTDNSETASVRGKSKLLPHAGDKQDSQDCGSQEVLVPNNGSGCKVMHVESARGGQPRRLENKNEAHHNSLRYLTANRLDAPGPVRKDGDHSAANVFKEARHLKHTANRLKNEGLEHESTGLYFQSALKFLHYASLLESSSSEGSRQGEHTMLMYSETAKLCKFCAHEYEKHKELTAAALTYKCMEVAYMRIVYIKNSIANKDLHELQTPLRTIQHGESPSSSASGVDNFNSQDMVDKPASVSPKIAGSHVISAHNRPDFARLLSYAQNVIFAMEASQKSLKSFSAASFSLKEIQGAEDIVLSVKRVLDYSFHDVEGLLRLVRLSIESIGH